MMKENFAALAEIMLTEDNPSKLRAAGFALYEEFCRLAELDDKDENPQLQDGTILSTGKAISPVNAARCLWEYRRTSQFLRGVLAAIRELQKRFPGEAIELLYAGCGPFAPLVSLLLDRFSPGDLRLTLLDYHGFSIETAKRIFEKLDLLRFAPEFVQTDAATYKHPRPLQLVVSETMQFALANETQTAITLNLAPQLCENGVFVPEKIDVEVCLTNTRIEFGERNRVYLGEILALDADQIRRDSGGEFAPVRLKIPAEAKDETLAWMLLTKIRVFDEFRLDDYGASITLPQKLRPQPAIESEETIEFFYVLDEKPRFEFRIF